MNELSAGCLELGNFKEGGAQAVRVERLCMRPGCWEHGAHCVERGQRGSPSCMAGFHKGLCAPRGPLCACVLSPFHRGGTSLGEGRWGRGPGWLRCFSILILQPILLPGSRAPTPCFIFCDCPDSGRLHLSCLNLLIGSSNL